MDRPCRVPRPNEGCRTGTSYNGCDADSPCIECVCLHIGTDAGVVGFAEAGVGKPELEPKEFEMKRAGHEAIGSPTATEYCSGKSLRHLNRYGHSHRKYGL